MVAPSPSSSASVAGHYDRLDRFYRRLWGRHVHHGLWTDPGFSPEEAVRHLVRRVARAARIDEGRRVCDVGCGYGAPARQWAETCGAEVVGFTVSEAQHTLAEQRSVDGPTPEYRLQDFLSNSLLDDSVDAVVAIESLTHIRDQPAVLREASRVLRPGGRFVACVWMASSSPSWGARRYLLGPICEEGHLSGLPAAPDLRRWAAQAGLQVEQLRDVTTRVRRTWTTVIDRFLGVLFTDSAVLRTLLDRSEPDRVFARTILRIWIAQHIGALRYGWLVARQPGAENNGPEQ